MKNEENLQLHVDEAESKQKNFILYSKTKRNSTVAMLKRFHRLRKPVEHTMVEIEKRSEFTVSDIKTIEPTVNPLESLKVTIEKPKKCNFGQS